MSRQGSQTWLRSPMPERGDPYNQHKLSPKSALSVIGVWQYERVQISGPLFFYFSFRLYMF